MVLANPSSPHVSVVIPCWNGEAWVRRAINSGLGQAGCNVELIVVDDGSSDGSLNVIRSFGDQIRLHSGPNQGAVAARNIGLKAATAEWIIFLDADDYLEPSALATWISACEQSGSDMVFGPFVSEFDGQKTLGRAPQAPVSAESIIREWLNGVYTPPCSVLWRRSFLNSIGGWNPEARKSRWDDGELAMRALILGARACVSAGSYGVYVQHDSPGRITKRTGDEVWACELGLLTALNALATERKIAGSQMQFARAIYLLAYSAFVAGADDTGAAALTECHRLGLKGHLHFGSVFHKLLASTLGLRAKLKLTGYIRRRMTDWSFVRPHRAADYVGRQI